MKHFSLLLLLIFLAACSDDTDTPPVPTNPTTIPNSFQQLRDDMTEDHVAPPRGVPASMDWSTGPRIGYGNEPPADWNAMITWGQVYAAAGATAAPNTRVQVKNLQTWYLSKSTNEWINWQRSSNVGGANYAEDFQEDENIPTDLRAEAEGYSATVPDDYNFHFWVDELRPTMDPTDIAAVWTAIDARLILDDPNESDDRATSRLMMSAGADYWESPSAQWDQWTTNGDIAIGRFRWLTEDWQTYNMHTMSEEILVNNPPPL